MTRSSAFATTCWVDGRLVGDAPSVLATDHGLTVGDGVFETFKVIDGHVFALTRHLRRLARSAAGLGLAVPDVELVRSGITDVLAAAHLPFGRLRVTMTGGPGPLGSDRADVAPTYVVLASAVQRPTPSAAVAVVPWVRNERSAVVGLKTTSYAENVVALAYARRRGAGEALFANTRDELCEGTGSNVLLALDGRLIIVRKTQPVGGTQLHKVVFHPRVSLTPNGTGNSNGKDTLIFQANVQAFPWVPGADISATSLGQYGAEFTVPNADLIGLLDALNDEAAAV